MRKYHSKDYHSELHKMSEEETQQIEEELNLKEDLDEKQRIKTLLSFLLTRYERALINQKRLKK